MPILAVQSCSNVSWTGAASHTYEQQEAAFPRGNYRPALHEGEGRLSLPALIFICGWQAYRSSISGLIPGLSNRGTRSDSSGKRKIDTRLQSARGLCGFPCPDRQASGEAGPRRRRPRPSWPLRDWRHPRNSPTKLASSFGKRFCRCTFDIPNQRVDVEACFD